MTPKQVKAKIKALKRKNKDRFEDRDNFDVVVEQLGATYQLAVIGTFKKGSVLALVHYHKGTPTALFFDTAQRLIDSIHSLLWDIDDEP